MESSERVVAVANKKNKDRLRYGGRKTDKLVRCYEKKKLGIYRVEVELHSGLLRRHDISTLDDFFDLPYIVYPKHLQFVDLDWRRLEAYLSKRPRQECAQIISGARRRASSLRRLQRYLLRKGVVNIHRFFVPVNLNEEVRRALNRWSLNFKKGMLWVKMK
jgi:hypothetical protein